MGIEKIAKSTIEALTTSKKKIGTDEIKKVVNKFSKNSPKLKPQPITDEFTISVLQELVNKNNKPPLSLSDLASKLKK